MLWIGFIEAKEPLILFLLILAPLQLLYVEFVAPFSHWSLIRMNLAVYTLLQRLFCSCKCGRVMGHWIARILLRSK